MHGVRGSLTTVLVAIILVLGCWAQYKPVPSPSPLSEVQLSVYRGFLNSFSSLNFRNLSSVTVPFDYKGFPDGRPCLRGLAPETVSEPLQTSHTFDQEITRGTDLRLVDQVERGKLRQQGDSSRDNQKENVTVEAQKPNFDFAYLVLSEIVFDTKHQFALLKYLIVCGQHCVSGATLVMEKVDGKWTTSSRRPCAVFLGGHHMPEPDK
jgi:hypothetical protein